MVDGWMFECMSRRKRNPAVLSHGRDGFATLPNSHLPRSIQPKILRYEVVLMKQALALIILLVCFSYVSGTLVHRYNFNANLSDDFAGADLVPVHTYNAWFDSGTWNWMADTAPGAGLLLKASLANPQAYSLRIVFKYQAINPVWTKIISFQGYNSETNYFSSDFGVYFNHGNPYLYPYMNNINFLFLPNTWYDLVLTRSADGLVNLYLNPLGQARQFILQYYDIYGTYTPAASGGYSCWGLFYDDTTTTSEWTTGGSVALIEVYDAPLVFNQVQNISLVNADGDLTLSWDEYFGASSYNIYASEDMMDGSWELLNSTSNTSMPVPSDLPKRFYYVKAVE